MILSSFPFLLFRGFSLPLFSSSSEDSLFLSFSPPPRMLFLSLNFQGYYVLLSEAWCKIRSRFSLTTVNNGFTYFIIEKVSPWILFLVKHSRVNLDNIDNSDGIFPFSKLKHRISSKPISVKNQKEDFFTYSNFGWHSSRKHIST